MNIKTSTTKFNCIKNKEVVKVYEINDFCHKCGFRIFRSDLKSGFCKNCKANLKERDDYKRLCKNCNLKI